MPCPKFLICKIALDTLRVVTPTVVLGLREPGVQRTREAGEQVVTEH